MQGENLELSLVAEVGRLPEEVSQPATTEEEMRFETAKREGKKTERNGTQESRKKEKTGVRGPNADALQGAVTLVK